MDHILPRVLQLLAAGLPPSRIDADEFRQMVDHLMGCDICRAGLVALADISALSTDDADAPRAHVEHSGDDTTDSDNDWDEELAAYAIIAHNEGRAVAEKRLPALARHLQTCPICQEALPEVQAELASIAGPPRIAEAADEVAERPQSKWARTSESDEVRRLVSGYDIFVERMSVRITSTLVFPQIVTDYTGNARYLDQPEPRSGTASARQREQSFMVDLRDETASSQPWVRVRVSWRALFTGRLSGQITARRIASASGANDTDDTGEDVGEHVGELPWSIERWRDDEAPQALGSGVTSARGIARFTFHDNGRFTLTVTADGHDWQIPFTVAPEIHPEPEPGAER